MPAGHGGQHGGHGGGGEHRTDLLDVTPDAVPALRAAFADARDRVARQLELSETTLRVQPWAKDPVSQEATTGVNQLTADHERAALDALRAYRTQLDTAVHTLDRVAAQYHLLEEDNAATVTQQGTGG
ncbi:PE domain-containing protein [Actinokineospora terrae]|uniref:PE family protein n=1 Tax=Actinokineospora terrae TaxID=155974 RepID=A0A1H9SBR0_9PSEU|nr:PE domain-containing protein [Actinokineospora terrae]SER82427.1 PE family protein [Actinokineospora terrae]